MRYYISVLLLLLAVPAWGADWWGERPDSGTQYFYTNTLNTSGVGVAPADETIRVYKNGGGDGELLTTGASIDDDYESATAGTDALAGLHRVAIDTTQSGFDAGSNYTVVYVTATSDGVSIIGRTIGSFRLVAAESTAGYPNVTIKDGTGTGELDTASGVVSSNMTQIEGADATDTLLTLQEIIDGILNEATSGHSTAGTIGKAIIDMLADTTALNDTTRAEPSPGAPGATVTLASKIDYLYSAWRNKMTQTATDYTLFSDDGTTEMVDTTTSDDDTTFTRNEQSAP